MDVRPLLLTKYMSLMSDLGVRVVELTVPVGTIEAISLYFRHGFRVHAVYYKLVSTLGNLKSKRRGYRHK